MGVENKEIAELKPVSSFREFYDELGKKAKIDFRIKFLVEFGYASKGPFYIKVNEPSGFSPAEKKWIAERFNKTVEELFPDAK